MDLSTRALGDYGERLACRYLLGQGLTILDRNWRCVRGEIDVVAVDGRELVVCEVKTRTSDAYGAPKASLVRVLTSQTTSSRPSTATTSISPRAQRQFRSMIVRPSASR